MDIHLGAEVYCSDGHCGRCSCVIVDPVTDRATHVVVEESRLAPTGRLVPVELIQYGDANTIRLDCTTTELRALQPFMQFNDPGQALPLFIYGADEYRLWPYLVPEGALPSLTHENVPVGETVVHKGAHVRATDGLIGRVDDFLVDPTDERLTHLVLREGHLWGQREVLISASQIDRIEDGIVYLKIDRRAIEILPPEPKHAC